MKNRLIAFLLASIALCSCSSPEQVKQQRFDSLKSCIDSGVHDLLDRNPQTMRDSMNRIFSFEYSEEARQKLMDTKLLPETGLSVIKTIQDEEAQNLSNSVHVSQVKPLSALDKPLISAHVKGFEAITKNGSLLKKRPFAFRIKVNLPLDSSLTPQIVEVKTERL